MPHSQVRSAVTGIFGAGVKTKLPYEVLPLWNDPDKEEILVRMPEFS